mmetsp:Transcript_115624/g.332043  ORF Transcript_115624/g.332043 Transcript_115624/m.332043 type:complete len:247 (-) Transcript_115624:21-761(-)
MGRAADHDVGLCDAPLGSAPVPVRLHCHQDALCAACGEGSAAVGPAVVHIDDHAHDFRIHLPQCGEDAWVQRIGEGPLREDATHEVMVLLLPMVHRPGHLALGPLLCVQLRPSVHQRKELRLLHALRWESRPRFSQVFRELLPKGPQRARHLPLDLVAHHGQALQQRGERVQQVAQEPLAPPDPPYVADEPQEENQDHRGAKHAVRLLLVEQAVHDAAQGFLEREHAPDHLYRRRLGGWKSGAGTQ